VRCARRASQLAPQLARGECDVALIPIAEHFRGVGEEVSSDACIGSSARRAFRPAVSSRPVRDINSVAADASSRTSVALLHIILEDAYGIAPAFREHAPDLQSMLHTTTQPCSSATARSKPRPSRSKRHLHSRPGRSLAGVNRTVFRLCGVG
jgi:predicted solute-binding protein